MLPNENRTVWGAVRTEIHYFTTKTAKSTKDFRIRFSRIYLHSIIVDSGFFVWQSVNRLITYLSEDCIGSSPLLEFRLTTTPRVESFFECNPRALRDLRGSKEANALCQQESSAVRTADDTDDRRLCFHRICVNLRYLWFISETGGLIASDLSTTTRACKSTSRDSFVGNGPWMGGGWFYHEDREEHEGF